MIKPPQTNLLNSTSSPNILNTPPTSPNSMKIGTMTIVDNKFEYHASWTALLLTCGREYFIAIEWAAVVNDERIPNVTPRLGVSLNFLRAGYW